MKERENAVKKTGGKVLDFLREHRLAETPTNYALGYAVVTQEDGSVARAVREIADGGVRVTQDEADDIMRAAGTGWTAGGGGSGAERDDAQTTSQMLHRLLRVADIAADTRHAAGDLGRDLSASLEALASTPEVAALVSAMVQRASEAEARLAESASEVDRLRQDLESAKDDATRDALTGLPNRRAIDARLAELAKSGVRRSVALCDVDHFKRINDGWGHAVGDRVLGTVGRSLAESCGDHFVGRWGGEEFVVIVEGDAREAVRVVDGARRDLANRHFRLRETDAPLGAVTFSAGVSDATDATVATREADERLYRAKEAGRNRVEHATGDGD